jgi:hypothetical protein
VPWGQVVYGGREGTLRLHLPQELRHLGCGEHQVAVRVDIMSFGGRT